MVQRPREFLIALVLFFVVGPLLLWVMRAPEKRAHRALVMEQFHLPPDVTFAVFDSARRSRGGAGSYVEAVVQFTPDQYHEYKASLNDRTVWAWEPFSMYGVRTDARPEPDTLRWWSGHAATVTREAVAAWPGWGFKQGKPIDGKPSVWDVHRVRTFCFAIDGKGSSQRVAPCLSFPGRSRPSHYVRAMLDEEHQRLFIYLR